MQLDAAVQRFRSVVGPEWVFNRRDEGIMKQVALERAEQAVHNGRDAVIDNTNLTEKARQPWIDLAKRLNVPFELMDIDTPVAECVRRDSWRVGKDHVGRARIERMALFTGWIDWSDTAIYPRDFIIVDMDGTLADCSARRAMAFTPEKKDWDLFYQGVEHDPPIVPIRQLLWELCRNRDIIVVSGRPIDKAGKATEDWLRTHLNPEMPIKHLFMRNSGDFRKDYVIKQEILDLLPKDRIRYVLDDRDQVVEMWRKNGLTCLQVADGRF